VNTGKRSKQLKSLLNFESETDKEIRSDIEGKILKSSVRVFEYKH
jgi:hypothetical protein